MKKKSADKGIESLRESVMHDCVEHENCFNPNGCDKKGSIKCFHRYCNKYKWVIDRAEHYATIFNKSVDDVIAEWEKYRTYWYMNYYQDCNQPLIKGDNIVMFDDWTKMIIEKYGDKKSNWTFKCPSCGHAQSMKDFEDIDEDPNNAYINCMGRFDKDKGCDWAANGFINICKTTVIKDLKSYHVFEIA